MFISAAEENGNESQVALTMSFDSLGGLLLGHILFPQLR